MHSTERQSSNIINLLSAMDCQNSLFVEDMFIMSKFNEKKNTYKCPLITLWLSWLLFLTLHIYFRYIYFIYILYTCQWRSG